ncbi:MAG: polymer-forming cytoskeletal protein [Anaerolineaceae bacterium]|jgi:cytoskeletal protein CcmA (bactofilin family)|nr:polymer-forming cytoskeletal protein [Anaerolineaceae bacterium]MDD4042717.1 polymer-forming cytoskeletal protein [Anaerolineaceae bacterium]MDD4577074.1 polymer-forming cytoskeletal protein [Anaerolineaceae bacterium]
MLFSKKKDSPVFIPDTTKSQVTSVIGPGINWVGDLRGRGGVRIEGTINGEIAISGLIVIGETGKVACKQLKADTVIVAGTVKGDITCQKLEIRSSGKVWGDVVTTSFSSEDGAFFRGQMRMEERVEPVEPPAEIPFEEVISENNTAENGD